VRCDNKQPECSRCIDKAIKCQYPTQNIPRATEARIETGDDTPAERENITLSSVVDDPGIDNRQTASDDSEIVFDGALVTLDPDFINLGGESVDWDDPNIDFSDFINPQTKIPDPASESLTSLHNSASSTAEATQVEQDLSAPSLFIPAVPSCMVRSLIHRPKMHTGAQRITNLILHNLKSYPLMMLRSNTLPPFIHPSFVSSDIENVHMEPLTNCISLVHMISSEVRGSRTLFWNNVRAECERFSSEVG
jgi:hypothetical protein